MEIGHTSRKGKTNFTCQDFQWTPQEKRKRGGPRLHGEESLKQKWPRKYTAGIPSTNYQRTDIRRKELSGGICSIGE